MMNATDKSYEFVRFIGRDGCRYIAESHEEFFEKAPLVGAEEGHIMRQDRSETGNDQGEAYIVGTLDVPELEHRT